MDGMEMHMLVQFQDSLIYISNGLVGSSSFRSPLSADLRWRAIRSGAMPVTRSVL